MHSSKLIIIVVAQILYMIQAMPKKVNMTNACEKQNFCFETDSNYPYDKIRSLMENYNIDIIGEEKETEIRYADPTDQLNQPCNSITITDPIYYITDIHGDVRYVVQGDNSGNVLQRFHVVKCSYPGPVQPSKLFNSDAISRYNIRCVNRLVPVQFLVLSHDGLGVETVAIKDGLPMACSCEYDVSDVPDYQYEHDSYYYGPEDVEYNA